MARKSMKSRVPADVWEALTAMKQGDMQPVDFLGQGAQGAVFAVKNNPDWVIKRWFKDGESTPTGERAYVYPDWKAKHLAKTIARGQLADKHLPNIIYAVGRYVVMERLKGHPTWKQMDPIYEAKALPFHRLPKELHSLRRAMNKMRRAGFDPNDVASFNTMYRKDGTIVLNDVVA